MSKQAIVLIEKFALRTTTAVALQAVAQGHEVILLVPQTYVFDAGQQPPFRVIHLVDWRTETLEAALQAIESQQEIAGIGSILGFFTGDGLLGAQVAELCARRGLPHTPAAALFRANNKYLMRQCLQQQGVYTIRHARVHDQDSLLAAAKTVGFPLILKPVVGLGSSFISRCDSVDDMQRVFQHYLEQVGNGFYAHFFCDHSVDGVPFHPLREMLAEEAIDGDEISVEVLCSEEQIHTLVLHDKLDVQQEAYCSFENLLITPPVRLDVAAQEKVFAYTRQVVAALGLKHCFCHVELRYDRQGRPSVIEVNPRIGGMRVKDSLRTLRGIHYETVFLQQLQGLPVAVPSLAPGAGYYGMLAIYPRRSGTLRAIDGVEAAAQLPGMLDICAHVPLGAKVGGDFEEVFVVDAWFRGDSPDDILALEQQVKSLVEVIVDAES